ncbi:MAG: exonuclease domain-containing protein [Sulfurimonas sp.]|uniref:exonuclease domain-containing protein n=1 Tax=Sulfurimonas sp. TaxID=2022749 RepID=UPI0025FFB9B2|nr:exonuclease domain-containing protein [Sulfurimonas sp.]MCK9491838.1 exonuclease domain-containing protein [Sulfurimonas sp.]
MLIFLDTETTGLDPTDKICSIAVVYEEDRDVKSIYELVNEGKKIPPLASSINHITNEMIKGKPKLQDTKAYGFLQAHNDINTTIIGHNINFDLKMLRASGFEFFGSVVDTLRATRHLIKECEFFSLQFLRYELKLYKQEKEPRVAHQALSDAMTAKSLYEMLLDLADESELVRLTSEKVLLEKFEFGKYNGRYIEEISLCDRRYLEWMLANIVDLDEDLRYSITYYLGR